MANDNSSGPPPSSSVLSILERLTHFPTVLLILAFLLASDIAISFGYQGTLMSFSWDFAQRHITIGDALIFIFAFGLYMSIGAAIVRYIADQLAMVTVQPLWYKLFPENDSSKPPRNGVVRPWKLREVAHIEQNKFYLDLYNEHAAMTSENEKIEWHLASTAFACLFLGGINYVVLPRLGYSSSTYLFASNFPAAWVWISGLLSLLLSAIWLMPMLRDHRSGEWVYCMSLYQKLEDEKRRAREEGTFPRF